MCKPAKAVLFDLDGTLLDTETLSTNSITAAIAEFGVECDWPLKQKLLGKSIRCWPQIVVEDCHLEGKITAEEIARRWERHMVAHDAECAVLPGVQRLVAHLAAVGLPMAICTSSPSTTVAHKRLHREELFRHFPLVVCGDDAELKRGKPAPDIFLLGAQRLGIDPEDCVVFEDSVAGVQAGKAAGMRVVAIPDLRLLPQFRGLADVVLASLEDLQPEAVGLPAYRCPAAAAQR